MGRLGIVFLVITFLWHIEVGGAASGSALAQPPATAAAEPFAWPTTTPEAQGLDSVALADVLAGLQRDVPGLHSLLMIRDGKIVVDAPFYPYDGSTPHELASVTKSVMTTLIGIAADHGYLALDQPMLDFFPDREVANLDARKKRVTVADLASMTGGLDCAWRPDEPTLDAMRASDDWIQFALDRPMVAEPGERWEYCSPDMHLLSAILTEATGMTALDFGWMYLFDPLGMREVIWPADAGYSHGWGDISLYPRDAAKLGQFWLDDGAWQGRQIVSAEWVAAAVTDVSRTPDPEDDYGYGWWVDHESEVGGEYRAAGRGGNYVIVYPAFDAIVVTTGGGTFSSGDVTDRLAAAILNPTGSIPANPAGVARLSDVVAGLAQPPAPRPVAPSPPVAQIISGTTFAFATTAAGIEAISLRFDGSTEATLTVMVGDRPGAMVAAVGLDGRYRFTPADNGFPLGLRGTWIDEDTFQLEWAEIANIDSYELHLTFDSGTVVIEGRDLTRGDEIVVEGSAIGPPAAPEATPA